MKRYGVILLAVLVGALGIGAAAMAAKKSHKPGRGTPRGARIVAVNRTVTVNCTARVQDQAPADQTGPVPGAQSGTQAGTVTCDHYLGNGVAAASFQDQDAGDTTGGLGLYFGTGTVAFTFDQTPADAPDTATTPNFTSTDASGPLALIGSTGTFDGIKLKKDSGNEECTSDDSVHYVCKLSMTLALPTEFNVVG